MPQCGFEQEHNKFSPMCVFMRDISMFGMRNGVPQRALRKSPRQQVMVVPGVPYDWYPVDGGEGRACRGATRGDNNPSYYSVVSGAAGELKRIMMEIALWPPDSLLPALPGIPSLDVCKYECLKHSNCTGGGPCHAACSTGSQCLKVACVLLVNQET